MTPHSNRRASLIGAGAIALASGAASAQGAFDADLIFDPDNYETVSVTLDGAETTLRRYDIIYVGQPIEMDATQPPRGVGPNGGEPNPDRWPLEDAFGYHRMFVFVPESAIGNEETAIILNVHNGGWFASGPSDIRAESAFVSDSDDDQIGAALAAGYVIVDAGTRSRGAQSVNGEYVGKAPAAVVDAKAVVRYLRLNDDVMPGSADRVVISGTSGGGALSVAVASSGNNPDYYPYLAEIGAAGIAADGTSTLADDVFATIAYCPITDLGNADIAYEWQFQGVRTAANTITNDYAPIAEATHETLAAAFPAYVESLNLTRAEGTPLTADGLREEIVAAVRREAEQHIAQGGEIPALGAGWDVQNRNQTVTMTNTWLDVQDGAVVAIDYAAFLAFVADLTPLKIVPAFDSTANTDHPHLRGESSLFGSKTQEYGNFTAYAWDNNQVEGDGSGPDDTGLDFASYIAGDGAALGEQIRLIDPITQLAGDTNPAPYWYVRHGMIDRDTSFAVELLLYQALLNADAVKEANFELAWLRWHSGNYDVKEAFAWLAGVLAEAD